MERSKAKRILLLLGVLTVVFCFTIAGAYVDRAYGIKFLDSLILQKATQNKTSSQTVVTEENVVIDVAERVSPSVVTVSIQTPKRRVLELNPFGGFSQRIQGGEPQDIGTGFIVSSDGLIVTNKHVVSNDGTYKVITKDNKEYEVKTISRDSANDIAVLKIDPSNDSGQALIAVEMGSSSGLKVGQFVIAIGTALGEFRHTVTTGVISGLGRGITAGSAFEGYVERLDDVIQTDAAINPGNSGGPLLNSSGQVIGINVAVASSAQNIGFAIPVNIVNDALAQYKSTGNFASRAYLGVEYQMVSRQAAITNNVPQGAYIVNVIVGSPAESASLEVDDIVVKMADEQLTDENTLADVIKKKKVGDKVVLEVWRDNETLQLTVTLSESSE